MFAIYVKNKNKYFCKENKPIAFELFEDAYNFANGFANYAINIALSVVFQEGFGLLEDVQSTLKEIEIQDFDDKKDFYPFEKIKNR